jgi:hypothetical protein
MGCYQGSASGRPIGRKATWQSDEPSPSEIASKSEGEPGFTPVKIRWVVEQSHPCLGRCRLIKDHERLTASSETWVQHSARKRRLRRLKPGPNNPQAEFMYPKAAKTLA